MTYVAELAVIGRTTVEDGSSKWKLSPWGDRGGGFWVVAVILRTASTYRDVRIYQARRIPDWNAYALVGTIELARGGSNPALPSWLEPAYGRLHAGKRRTRELWNA
jgi:hypothetical protein